MTKLAKTLLIIAVCLVLVGFGVGLYGWIDLRTNPRYANTDGAGRFASFDSQGTMYLREGLEFEREFTEEISDLRISNSLSEMHIYKSPDNVLRVQAKGFREDEIITTVENGRFTFDTATSRNGFHLLNLGGLLRVGFDSKGRPMVEFGGPQVWNDMEVNLYLPAKFYDEIELNTGVGEVECSMPLEARIISLEADVGAGEFEKLRASAELTINTGVGAVWIGEAAGENVYITSAVGDVEIDSLTAHRSAQMDCQVGRTQVKSALLNNATIHADVGEFSIAGQLLGNTYISQGVGNIELAMKDSIDNYCVRYARGIGDFSAYADGKTTRWSGVGDDVYYLGNEAAANTIEIDGGLGQIDIFFR